MSRPAKFIESPPYFLYSYGIREMMIKPKRGVRRSSRPNKRFGSRLSEGRVLGTPHFPCTQEEPSIVLGLRCVCLSMLA